MKNLNDLMSTLKKEGIDSLDAHVVGLLVIQLQLSAGACYGCIEKFAVQAGYAHASYRLSTDKRIVEQVNSYINRMFVKLKEQNIFDFKKRLIHAGCSEKQIQSIAEAFAKDLEEVKIF